MHAGAVSSAYISGLYYADKSEGAEQSYSIVLERGKEESNLILSSLWHKSGICYAVKSEGAEQSYSLVLERGKEESNLILSSLWHMSGENTVRRKLVIQGCYEICRGKKGVILLICLIMLCCVFCELLCNDMMLFL